MPNKPVIGDGVVTITIPDAKDYEMDPEVAKHLMTETVGNIQENNREGRDSAALAQAHLRFAASRNFDELGPTESRAVSGVMATPVASPTTQSTP